MMIIIKTGIVPYIYVIRNDEDDDDDNNKNWNSALNIRDKK
jgi:hypothetical protein